MRRSNIYILLLLVALLLPGCAKTASQPHVHTWENRKCVTCGEEKEIHRLGNWEYVLWEEEETMEIISFPETDEKVFFRDLPEKISKVRIGDGITAIPDYAFAGCENLVDVVIPKTARTIGKCAFAQCINLARINIPEGVTSIGDYAFLMCSSLNRLTIPDSVTALGDWAFRGCTALTRLAIPDSVTSIGYDTFGSCPDLTLTVGCGSYAAQYAEENSIPYAFANAGS